MTRTAQTISVLRATYHCTCYRFCKQNSFIYFRRAKVAKRPAHGPSSRSLLGSRCCILQHPSFVLRLPLQAFSAVCRVLRNALRAAILKKYNCRPTFERSSHNGLHASGLSAVSVTVPVLFLELPLCAGESLEWRASARPRARLWRREQRALAKIFPECRID